MDLYLFDKGFTPSSEIPTFQKITQFQGAFSTNQGSQILIQLSKFSIETDHGILPIEDIKTEEGYYVHPFSFTTIYESRQPHAYISFLLVFSDEHKTIKRVVGKFDEILSYAGGLFSIVIAFLGFFLLSFNEYRY